MESIVRAPQNPNMDYDFIAFTFGEYNSYDDFGIYRVIKDRHSEYLAPTINDKTAEIAGRDGAYLFSSQHKPKQFNIDFAFDNLDEIKLRAMKEWLSGKEMKDLWFAEAPYKVYCAKVTGHPVLKYIPFEEEGKRVYKGEGTVQFTAYWPYAHTPDLVYKRSESGSGWVNGGSGKVFENYLTAFGSSANQWKEASGLSKPGAGACTGENFGDLPAPFIFESNGVSKGGLIWFGTEDKKSGIEIGKEGSYFRWDSKTGIAVINREAENEEIIPIHGTTVYAIPPDKEKEEGWKIGGDITPITLKYHYWYY